MFKRTKTIQIQIKLFWDFIKQVKGNIDKNCYVKLFFGLNFIEPNSHAYNHPKLFHILMLKSTY